MFLSYGTYKHQIGGCNVSIDRQSIKNAAKLPIAVLETWTVQGMLTSLSGPTDIDQQITALMAAYAQDGQDLVLFMPDGTTPSASTLKSADCVGGTRVMQQPSFPTGQNAERVTYVHFSVKVEGEKPIDPQGFVLTDYHESLKFRGGVPLVGYLEPAVGLPQPQLFKQFTSYKATQEGNATGYGFQPTIGVDVGIPIWPANIVGEPEFDYDAPERQGGAYKDYKVTWHYEYQSQTPLIGVPTPWPINL